MKKLEEKISNNMINIFTIFLLCQAFIDILTYLTMNNNITIGVLIRTIFLGGLTSFNIFFKKSKNLILASIIFVVYLIGYLLINDFSFLELSKVIKVFYLPFILICLIDYDFTKIELKKLTMAVYIYVICIIIAYLTNSANSSYEISKVGSSGWFNAANEVSAIISLSIPLIMSYLKMKKLVIKISLFILLILSIIILGTKSPIISLFICLMYYFIKLIINKVKEKQYGYLSIILGIIIICVLGTIIILPETAIYKNTVIHYNYLGLNNIFEVFFNVRIFDHFFLGERLLFLYNNFIYLSSQTTLNIIFGIGYQDYTKLVEMDFFDIIIRQGLLGFITYIYLIYLSLKQLKIIKKSENILSIILIVLISFIVGHVLVSPAVSIFVIAIILILSKKDSNDVDKK